MTDMRTALYDEHLALSGKMVSFAGWELPVQYTSIVEEHMATRQAAGLFDISHMGEFRVSGSSAADFIASLIPTRMSKLEIGKSMYSCFCTEDGGVIDDLFIYMMSDTEFMFVVNAANISKDFAWMKEHLTDGVQLDDLSDAVSKIDLQGPLSKKILNALISDSALEKLERFHFIFTEFEGKRLLISNSGYTGELGYELYTGNETASSLWKKLLETGRPLGLIPAGLGARDSLRIESCYSLYGHEISDSINPVEGGIGWLISSEAAYPGKEVLTAQKKSGAAREIICLEMTGRGIPRGGYRISFKGTDIGYVTSGVYSPMMKNGIALALVDKGTLSAGDEAAVVIRGKDVAARVVKRPFYTYNG